MRTEDPHHLSLSRLQTLPIVLSMRAMTRALITECEHKGLPENAAYLRGMEHYLQSLLDSKYSPNQPRVPAGSPDGGQWTDGNGGGDIPKWSTSSDGIDFIARHEAFRASVYKDQFGYDTIGYGHRMLPKESYPNGISEQYAKRLLAQDVKIAERAIRTRVKVPLTQNQFDALTSLTYNIGSGSRGFSGSTILRLLYQKEYNQAADHFMDWNKGKATVNGRSVYVVSQGLVNRRNAERNVFLYGRYR